VRPRQGRTPGRGGVRGIAQLIVPEPGRFRGAAEEARRQAGRAAVRPASQERPVLGGAGVMRLRFVSRTRASRRTTNSVEARREPHPVTAPSLAEWTVRAYFASTPRSARIAGFFHAARRRPSSASSRATLSVLLVASMVTVSPSLSRASGP